VFHGFAARRPAPRAAAFSLAASAAAFSLTAATAAARPPSCPGLRLDPRHGFRVVIHRTANRMPHESWNLVDRVAVHLGNNLVGTEEQVAFVAHDHGTSGVAVTVGFANPHRHHEIREVVDALLQ